MDPQAQVAAISGFVTLVLGVGAWFKTRNRPGLNDGHDVPADPSAVVQRLATDGIEGLTPRQVSVAVTALAQTITELQGQVTSLRSHEYAYQKRIAVVTHIAVYSNDPPPRQLPPWPDEPQLEG